MSNFSKVNSRSRLFLSYISPSSGLTSPDRTMTPDEINRAIDSMMENQGCVRTGSDQDHEQRRKFEEQRAEIEEWSRAVSAQVVQLNEIPFKRPDDPAEEGWEARHEDEMYPYSLTHKDAIERLDRVLIRSSASMN